MEILKNYINGKWVDAENEGYINVENPSTGEILAEVPLSTAKETNKAIEAAKNAFPIWRNVPVSRRVRPLFLLNELLRANEEKITRILVAEMGKSFTDGKAEIKRIYENIEVACGIPMLQQGVNIIGISQDIDGEILKLPLGVFALIAPFNFPGMIPFMFLPYAIATGNTFILKASKQVPMTMQEITKFIDQCGFPPGVFNLVNGDKKVADAFINSPDIKGVSIVGSSKTCRIVYEECAKVNKRCQAMGGAKNHLVVMPDANLDMVIRNMTSSCYGCAGQRCMASSAIIGIGKMYDIVCKKFIEDSKNVIVANPLDPEVINEPMVMGPVISKHAKDFILSMIETGIKEGATLALDGRNIVVPGSEKGYFIGPTIFTDVKPGMKIHETEIFGPVVVILKADNLDEAIKIINNHKYGHGASIYTQNGYYARKFKLEVECGMIGVNVGIPAPVAQLPLGGMKESHFGDIKAQGKVIIDFYTEDKIITERYFEEKEDL